MCAHFAGGPSQTLRGRIWLTQTLLAFRPIAGMPHPQVATVQRRLIERMELSRRSLLGHIRYGRPLLEVWVPSVGAPLPLTFDLDDAEGWRVLLRAPSPPPRAPRVRLREALDAGLRQRGRHTSTLEQLSFPRGYWHSEVHEDLVELAEDTFHELGVDLPPDLLASVDLEVETLSGPEDYETGPGSDSWARREQIRRICSAANAVLSGDRRFYAFAEDLPEWAFDEPVWLLLSAEERDRMLELGVVRAPEDTHVGAG